MDDARERDKVSGHFSPDEVPEMFFEIRLADDAEAEQLRLEQARVLREVTEWVARKRSENGQDRAA
ncbi:hypothetical protein C8D88_102760 [Lentzea atacamensis]|uniref:Uncharacterized protein n=1 Tax=Lentzea atacamensis TaxID=531938 RepID=A0A316IAJ6_9PSEU|nr:hypothetical protein [Lentzea atacamensis]PWK89486.1 hypothetical protein C8D88_102760 [Lentzea atacamensis]